MLGLNSSTSRWVDVVEMAAAMDVEVVNDKQEQVNELLVARMAEYKKKSGKPGAGIVWRWMVGCTPGDSQVSLMVQALPCSLDLVKATPSLRQDNTRGIIVADFPIGYTAFNNIPGPVPMFFSEEPNTTEKELRKSPQFAFDCMEILMSRLLDTDQITKEFAEEFLKDPLLGKFRTPLVRTWETVAGTASNSQKKASKEEKGIY